MIVLRRNWARGCLWTNVLMHASRNQGATTLNMVLAARQELAIGWRWEAQSALTVGKKTSTIFTNYKVIGKNWKYTFSFSPCAWWGSINVFHPISGRCKFEKATVSDCPVTVSDDTAPPCTTLMRNDQVCEGDNPLPDGQTGAWIDKENNCGTNGDDVFKCMRGELYFLQCFWYKLLSQKIYMHFCMIKLSILF